MIYFVTTPGNPADAATALRVENIDIDGGRIN